jgi:Tfp pilus assembly protein PilX
MKETFIVQRATMGQKRNHKGEEGIVLLMVVLLILMFSGMGLLAMRHLQGELRSSGAYLDSTQAAAAAESAVMMVATDMRRNWRYPNSANTCLNYYAKFQQAMETGQISDIQTGFTDVFNQDGDCSHIGHVPLSTLNGSAPLALTGGPLSSGYANVDLSQAAPEIAPAPPGFSSDDEARTYGWYYFTVTSRASYGYGSSTATEADTDSETDADPIVRGSAVVRAHMKIGPVDSIGSN